MGRMHVQDALLEFPDVTDDKSVMASYHALVHYEADEDLRRRDELYREEQDDYIEFLSYIMDKGEDLPDNIIKSYEQYYRSANIPHSKDAKGFFQSFFRFLNI
ncbi:hypothetical protein IJZ97_06050 [bacterium]|nr:hypothetical protein [bacterium]